jgi:nucleoside permease NupC
MYEESNDSNLKMSNSVLIAIIVGLASISSSIILAYSTLPSWSIYIAIILIIVMTFVLLWISPLPYIIKKKRERRISNKLASTHFQKLMKKNFISQFEKNLSDDISFTFHNIVMRIKSKHSEFNSIPDPQVKLIKQRFYF